ncbi:hypothetical protein BTO04_02905 [Polaribacter sp. SA4-10]|uniref:DUF6452 family protein n=1 Tax=Polaribacter sp. SA4-10 TaxID=754397 RepID=UPI000B3C72B5|nr:DUF6452 family protein [Polaribacter sp. SA4-10]ARV05709.1 hypothetical protein BTO04_02905 [Polaribacter sp. SA4-10]
MKKTILSLLFLIIVISACEKDDFCLKNPVTPSLVINFYDDTNKETLKNVRELYVWAEGKTDSIYINQTINSITIPLNSLATEIVYNFSKENVVNQFTINYTTEEEYVSRSCGYKVNFNEVTFSSDTTWIISFTPETLTTIENQTEAHVQIFH